MNRVLPLDPACYARHRIHTGDRVWAETNCYVDVIVEQVHALGFEPIAALPFTLGIDFEGDQWTFFKFRHADLETLFGLDIQELAIWKPLVVHVNEQVSLGRPVLVELDSYFLPDTAGTAYQREHTKSTVSVNAIDLSSRRMEYFHNQGFFALEGADFNNVFRAEESVGSAILPPYVEIIKQRPGRALCGSDLAEASLTLLRRQLEVLPANPFPKFRERFGSDLRWLATEPLETFHKYSFATLRQFGACYELASTYLDWLGTQMSLELQSAAKAFGELANEAKTMQFQLARSMMRKKPLDVSPIEQMAALWRSAMDATARAIEYQRV
jgi:hypothetical protein